MKPILTLLALGVMLAAAAHSAETSELELQAAIAEETVESGAIVQLEATFRNTGSDDAQLFLPRHVGAVPFPTWILRHEDGRLFTPARPAFQSMWKRGLQGEVVKLAVGATRAFRCDVVRVLPFDEAHNRAAPTQRAATFLPPGRYSVLARYVKKDDRVPYSEEVLRTAPRRLEGLWTGRVDSPALPLVVETARRFAITLDARETVPTGASYPVALRIANASAEHLDQDVALLLTVGTKAHGSAALRFVMDEAGERLASSAEETERLTMAPGTVREVRVDLTTFAFDRDRPAHSTPVGFYELLGTGTFHLGARIVDADGRTLTEAGLYPRIEPLAPVAEQEGLRLRLEAMDDDPLTRRVRLTLVNTGTNAVCVPATLAWPHHAFFALASDGEHTRYAVAHGAGERRSRLMRWSGGPTEHATLPAPLRWDGDRYEGTPTATHPTIVSLAPGAFLTRMFVLDDLLDEKSASKVGRTAVQVTAYWRNREDGARWGAQPRLVVGLLRSNTIEVRPEGP